MSEPLRELGRAVSEHQDEVLLTPDLVDRVTSGLARRRARRTRRRAIAVAVLSLAAALVALLFVSLRGRAPAPESHPPSLLTARAAAEPYAFPDGTTVLVDAGSEATVLRADRDGGAVTLNRGRLRVSVPPERGLSWVFDSGPYRIEVQGTRFDVGWDPTARRFELEMLDGKVRVSGAGIEPRLVVAGQRLTLAEEMSGPQPVASATVDPPAPPDPPSAASATPSSASEPSASRSARAPASDGRVWQTLALEGNYVEAVAVAERAGFDSVLASSSASDLLLLADACRFAGEAARSRQAYEAVRKHHPGTKEAQRAIFSIGVLAFPNAPAVAAFEQYLTEAPDGPLAAEALGRVLEIRSRGQDRSAARAAARAYLSRFPNGSHKKLAQSLLDEAQP